MCCGCVFDVGFTLHVLFTFGLFGNRIDFRHCYFYGLVFFVLSVLISEFAVFYAYRIVRMYHDFRFA